MATPNFSEIAARVAAGSNDVRACLIVSQDGLTLGVFPEEGEEAARAAWGRIVATGEPEPERGFLTVGEEVWAFTRRGGYAALATAERAARPGLLLDALDGALKDAHQERVEAAPVVPPAAAAPPRPAARKASEPATPATRTRPAHAEPKRAERRAATPRPSGPPVRRLAPDESVEVETDVAVRQAEPEPEPEPAPAPPRPRPAAPVQVPRVDTVELTREFGGLFDGPGGR